MTMGVPFDHIASTYDSVFTHSVIGQLQRRHVWNYLEKVIHTLPGIEILELNCGTGEDAVLFSEHGFNILATDVSEEMLRLTKEKAQQFSLQHQISSHYLNLDNLHALGVDKKFDLIFSNFGGLNCIEPEALEKLIHILSSLLSPKGRFIGVLMPKHCIMETLYFTLKFQLKNAFRRWTNKSVGANLNGATINTWYYNPSQLKRWARDSFTEISVKPIGICLPPSYLERFFENKKPLLLTLNKLEKKLNSVSFLSSLADHYVIDLKVR